MTIFPQPPHFSLYLRLKIKLKGRHFDTTEVMEAESKAVMNTLTEQDFQMHLNTAEIPRTVHTRERGLLRGRWWPVSPRLAFDQIAARVQEIMDGCVCLFFIRLKKLLYIKLNQVRS
jgi:hypothetical protein